MAKSVLSRYLDPNVLSRIAGRRIEPRGLVIGNLAFSLGNRVMLGELGRWLRIRILRPTTAEISQLFGDIAAGPKRAAVQKALQHEP